MRKTAEILRLKHELGAYCAGSWPPISLEVGHPFRSKLAACFARSWPLFGDLPKWPAT